jgi:hypothetical protein
LHVGLRIDLAVSHDAVPGRRSLLWVVVLGIGVAYAIATGVGAPGVAAPRASLVAIVAFVALGARTRLGPVLGAGGAGGAASAAILAPGFPLGHDLTLHAWVLDSFGRAVLAGDFTPRWHAAIGLGTPLGLFYPPLPFWSGVPFYALGLAPAEVAKGALILLHVAAAASMAAAVLHAGRGRLAALASGSLYAIAPYLLFDLHGRGALGEATALVFLPWLLAGIDRALRGERGFAALLAGGVGVVHAHALALVMLASALPLAAVATCALHRGDRRMLLRGLGVAGVAGALSLAIGAHWLVPAWYESKHVALATVAAGAPLARYADYAPAPGDLVERRSVDHFVGSLPRALRQPGGSEMPYYAGIGLLIAAWAGARGARARAGDLFAASLLGVSLLLCLDPAATLWGRVEVLARVQFPWRHLLLATPAAAWLGGAALAALASRSRIAVAFAAIALLVDAIPYLGVPVVVAAEESIVFDANALTPPPGHFAPLRWNDRPLRCEDLRLPPADRRLTVWRSHPGYPEYMTRALFEAYGAPAARGDSGDAARRAGVACTARGAGIEVAEALPLVRLRGAPGSGMLVARFEDRGDVQRWRFASPVVGPLELRTAFFPGFRAHDAEGDPVTLEECGGWICLDVAEPTRAIELSFGATPVRRVGACSSAIASVAAIAWLWRRRASR